MTESVVGRHGRLILVPAVITLGVTLLRLIGELQRWSSALFNRESGGAGAIVGIVWLVPVFGIYFALLLSRAGDRPGKIGRALGLVLLALALLPAVVVGAGAAGTDADSRPRTLMFLLVAAAIAAIVLALRAWPGLGRVLVAYGLAARIPVVIVMLLAVLGDWGTHYDQPAHPGMVPLVRWFWIAVLPQLAVWMAFTVVVGMLFGLVAVAVVSRGRTSRAT